MNRVQLRKPDRKGVHCVIPFLWKWLPLGEGEWCLAEAWGGLLGAGGVLFLDRSWKQPFPPSNCHICNRPLSNLSGGNYKGLVFSKYSCSPAKGQLQGAQFDNCMWFDNELGQKFPGLQSAVSSYKDQGVDALMGRTWLSDTSWRNSTLPFYQISSHKVISFMGIVLKIVL